MPKPEKSDRAKQELLKMIEGIRDQHKQKRRIIFMNKEVAMTELDKGQKADRRPKKYLWLGYGNYGSQPNLQIPAGNIRDPALFEELTEESRTKRSPMAVFVYATSAIAGFMLFVMLLAWVVALILG